MSDIPSAWEIILEALPTDPDDGLMLVGYADDGQLIWDEPDVLADRIHAALVDAGYLDEVPA